MIVTLGNRAVGDGQPCLLVAELGINHNGRVDTAVEMVRAAAAAGADAVKIQAFTAASFCTEAAVWKGERQIDMFKRYELGTSDLSEIAHECGQLGLLFFGTPDSAHHAEALIALGAPCLKVGSDDLIHLPLLRELARFGVPLILSTGMANLAEIRDALDATSGVPRILLHCVSSYPTPTSEVNLARMLTLGKLYGSGGIVGYSDHTDGMDAAVGAAWLGACIIEKHFTLDRYADGPDHAFSADPNQFECIMTWVRTAEEMRGHGGLSPSASEREMRVTARRSIVAETALPKGATITATMLGYRRPGDGLPPQKADEMIGKRLKRSLAANEQIRQGDY